MPKLLTLGELADLLRLSVWTLRKRVHEGRLRRVPLSDGRWLFDPRQVEEDLGRQNRQPAGEALRDEPAASPAAGLAVA